MQVGTHLLLVQVSPAGQMSPQPPQLLGSSVGSMQAPLGHWTSGGLHPPQITPPVHWQVPRRQVLPVGQTSLQLPQLLGSVLGFTHCPLQLMSGSRQVETWQTPR